MNSQPEWVPKSLIPLFEDEMKRASERLASAERKNIPINQRNSGIQTELTTAARTGYAAIESTLRMAAAQILAERTDLSSDSRQQILETAGGYFSPPNISSCVAASWDRKKGVLLAAGGGALCGLALVTLAAITGAECFRFAGSVSSGTEPHSYSPYAGFIMFVGTVCVTAALGAAVYEAVWRSKSQHLAEEHLKKLPGLLRAQYSKHVTQAIDKYIAMIDANVKNCSRTSAED